MLTWTTGNRGTAALPFRKSLLVRSSSSPFRRRQSVRFRSNDNDGGDAQQGLMNRLREKFKFEIQLLPEQRAAEALGSFLAAKAEQLEAPGRAGFITPPTPPEEGYSFEMTSEQIRLTLDAALATFCLHVESRIAALVGRGYYTIGPCGEEALSAVGHLLREGDSAALHYRHLGINIARQLRGGQPLDQLLLDRARGYAVSRDDPVTGGVHCSIGSSPENKNASTMGGGDFIVTSTLASQCPSAVGRALGYALQDDNSSDKHRRVSLATVGDGSVHNHHFWSAFHLARHARHRRLKCPAVFGISDNGLSISYRTQGYVETLFNDDPLVPLYRANGSDMMDVYCKTHQAVGYSRKHSAPCVILFSGLVRRFGHAATDRQIAYLGKEEIEAMSEVDVLEKAMVQAVDVFGATSYAALRDRYREIQQMTQSAFSAAAVEEKVNREDMLQRASAPQAPVSRPSSRLGFNSTVGGKREVLRKHMTGVMEEVMEADSSVVYLGEDVQHGGYYLVTEGLAKKFPGRVLDFPPDETSLLGSAMGFSQVGLTPIVEIPYAKYLDCGADMFYEIAVMHWLSAGKRPNGMVVRLQGFDRGVFGGNFHTHNTIQHVPPGVDVVCFSNGRDYVRGFRHAVLQAKAGRVVVTIDCTSLLNLRHLHGRDRAWEFAYPPNDDGGGGGEHGGLLGFDEICRYGKKARFAVVTYGNGVVTALQARKALLESGIIQDERGVDIIDSPYLSSVPAGLRDVIGQYESVLFADICKDGPGSSILSSTICSLRRDGLLPSSWDSVAAPRTYNPLGSVCTFLNVDDIADACERLLAGKAATDTDRP